VQYEEDLLRNNFSVKSWLRYLEHKKRAPLAVRFTIYERALKELPGRCEMRSNMISCSFVELAMCEVGLAGGILRLFFF
jgi:hypothetical protein